MQNKSTDKKKKRPILVIVTILLAIAVLFGLSNSSFFSNKKEIPYSTFLDDVDSGKVDTVDVSEKRITIKLIDDSTVYYTGNIDNDELVKTLHSAGIEFSEAVDNIDWKNVLINLIVSWTPTIFLVFILFKLLGKTAGGIMNAGKVDPKVSSIKNTGITFKDVAGQEEAKEQLVEIIDFLHNPDKYKKIGAKLPKGALLVGPPGTGKTLLARAVAGEAKVPFFSISGSDFIEMYAGVGASRVRDLFKKAETQAPCIIFIDEVDTIAKSRDASKNSGNDEREQTLNQLLSEIDGFDSSKGIVVLAATNRPEILDRAFLRTGRFDRKIIVDKPDFNGRLATFTVHSKDVKLDANVNFEALSKATAGAVGADIANIINEAALRAVKMKRTVVTQSDLLESVETVFAGKEKKDRVLSEQERKIVAFHEIGHAVIAALQKNAAPIQKITIIPRTMGSLGYTMQVPEEEKFLLSKDDMYTELNTLLGGRSAEEVFFNSITTGASNDISRATDIVRKMITMYGMSDTIGLMSVASIESAYLDAKTSLNCSEDTASIIDKEIIRVLSEHYVFTKKMIAENTNMISEMAEYLLKKESISGDEFMSIFNKYHSSNKSNIISNIKKEVVSEPEITVIENTLPSIHVVDKKESQQTVSTAVPLSADISDIPDIPDVSTVPEELDLPDLSNPLDSLNGNTGDVRNNKPSATVFGPQSRKNAKKKTRAKTTSSSASDFESLLNEANKKANSSNYQEENNDDSSEITEDMY